MWTVGVVRSVLAPETGSVGRLRTLHRHHAENFRSDSSFKRRSCAECWDRFVADAERCSYPGA